ncbi:MULTISPECIES: tetratricopeptide repeat protein [unclassified Microcoleus]|uniref:tetratricopeptide repeat protein n=1 Tax=unclassified Microcoleus TaxID=2642155 RepID=UPI001DA90AF9|nr:MULTISPECIES: tetratricopeptide repeat protein [unclassified Microcoleus]MCC3600078.1 tetratricopeptide repeat protein [Microcoleus sp. PH2017_26_ELK_O_A]MCC3625067.1 tetratricopeptide repeat protein [Microcoleus sp. PH2017_36_ELK_O_B]
MTSNFAQPDTKTQQGIEGVDYTAFGKLVLANFDIDSALAESTEISLWELSNYSAVEWWLIKYKARQNDTNLEQVRGYIEGFHHLCELEEWEKASQIFLSKIDNNEELHSQLNAWGYYHESINICQRILGKLNIKSNTVFLNTLGNSYNELCNYTQATDCYQQILQISARIKDYKLKGVVSVNLGTLYHDIGDYDKALKYIIQGLSIAQEIEDIKGESCALANLGNVYEALAKHDTAINYYHKALKIVIEISDKRAESNILVNLGNAYFSLENYELAINYLYQGLVIAQKRQERAAESHALGNLGNVYDALEDYNRAIDCYEKNLVISQEIGDRLSESETLCNLGITLMYVGQYSNAMKHFQESLEICREIDNYYTAAFVYKNLAEISYESERNDLAHTFCNQALAISTKLGIPLAKECEDLKKKLCS